MIRIFDVAVIIPARNAAATLTETLDSVAAQTLPPASVVVVDDGSQDETPALARRHPSVSLVIEGGGKGAPHAMNSGVRATQGEWVAFLDSDDLWSPDRLALAAEHLESSDVDMVLGHCEAFLDPSVTAEQAARLRYQKERSIGYLSGACLVRRSVFEAVGGLDETLLRGHFIDFFDRVRRGGYRHDVIEATILRRRVRPGTLGSRQAGEQAGLSADFLALAHNAIRRRRATKPDDSGT